jgi:hypothetical protein
MEIDDVHLGPGEENQHDGDHHVHQRSGDGDQELLPRLLRDALEPSHAADRQQHHVGRRHAERARGEDMAELVRHHAGEQQQHEGERLPGRFRPARDPARHEDPAQEQNEGDVHENRRSGDPADIERPGHEGLRSTRVGVFALIR